MSLLRLLTTGRSWVGKKESTRYQEADPRVMPKFGGKQNPFSGKARTASETKDAAAKPAEEPPVKPVNLPAAPKGPAEIKVRPEDRLSKWFLFRREPKAAPIPRFQKTLVQTELSLDQVRVLRNDLSDCDLEIVPARLALKVIDAARRPEVKPPPGADSDPAVQLEHTIGK